MSLAEQLRRLQIPGQPVIQQIASKNVSLLFDVRTAASLDNDDIQNIGLHGFKELLLVDPIFSQFEQLFNANSLHFQRNMEHGNVSKKIKMKIRDYLIFLTPYLLLKPAQKTLEWLVRRYQCHIWDKDALIACILPFHESQIFGRIIQLFGTEPNNDSWDWLLTCQKEGSGFSTQSLINQCIENQNLLSFICKMAENAKEAVKLGPKSGLRVVFSFHARMLTSVVEMKSVISEDVLSFLLPFIHSGLKSQVRDFVCSTYMIITSLASKTKLMKDVTKAILASILKSMEPSWYEEGYLCFLSVLQFQNVKMLSDRIFKLFVNLKSNNCIVLLEKFEKEYDITLFIELLIPLLCKYVVYISPDSESNINEKSFSILKSFIDNLSLSHNQLSMICKHMIEECIAMEFEGGVTISHYIKDILTHLYHRYATIFDDCIGSFFNDYSANKDKTGLQKLKDITMNCLLSEKHCVYGDSDLPLLLSLNHPEENIRVNAVQQLFATFKSEIDVLDQKFFTDAVIARLNDDNDDVVSAVLKYPKSIIKILPQNTLQKLVMELMERSGNYNINELIVTVIQNFPVQGNSIEVNEFAYAIFGHLMFAFIGKRNKKLLEALDCVEFDSNNVILKGVSKALFHIPTRSLSKVDCTEEMVVSAFSSLVVFVAAAIIADENKTNVVCDLWNYIQKLPVNHNLQFIGLMLLIALVEKLPTLNVQIMKLNVMNHLEQYISLNKMGESMQVIDTDETCDDKKKNLYTQYYVCLKSEVPPNFSKLLDETFFTFIKVIIQSFINNQQNKEGSLVAKQKLFNILSAQSVNIDSSQYTAYRNLLNQFLAGAFIDKEDLFSFLCSMYIKLVDQTKLDDESFKAAVCALHITKRMLSKNDKGNIMKNDGIIYATHIALLSSPFTMIRKIVLDNINILSEIAVRNKVWSYLLKKAKESENEISVDPFYVKTCWQLSFIVKERSNFGRLIHKSKKDNVSDQKISSLRGLTKLIKNYPVSLQLCLLNSLEFVDHKYTMEDYIHLLKDALCKPNLNAEKYINVIQFVLKCIKSEMFDYLEDLFPLFVECMNHKNSVIQSSTLRLITPSFYSNMSSTSKSQLLGELLKILLSSNSVAVSTEVRVTIKALDLDIENVISLLQQFCDTFDQTYSTVASNTNHKFELCKDDLKIPMWRTLIEILEVISYKETTNHPEMLVPKVFHILERCLKCSGVEYVNQLLLQTLLLLTRQDLSKLSEDQFQVELLVQCLQCSNDTQTSHQCLMVLSNAAKLYPTRVLHNIMHIFSFMGGTMLRIDNAYSFEIIEKTINAVVPVLIKKDEAVQVRKRASTSSMDEIVTFILHTFVDSVPHCPEHRRQHIIKHLVKLLHASEHLYMVIILLLKKVTLQHHKQVSEEENMELSPITLEFCKDLFSTYPIPIQVHSLYKMIAYINTVVVEKKTMYKKREDSCADLLFDVNNKQVNLFKYTLMSFTLETLRNEKMETGYDVKPHKQENLTHLYLQLVEELLSYADKLGKSIEEPKSKSQMKSLQHKVSEVISQLYDLLPFDSFITIVSKLLHKKNELIRKKSLELLCKKLCNLNELSIVQENILIELCNTIMVLVKYKEENDEVAVNKQLMLYAVKLIAIKLCKTQKDPFLKAVPVVAELYAIEDSNQMLSINAMLCVAELSSLLKTDLLPYLPIIMKPLFAKLSIKDSIEYKKGDMFLSSGITILHTLLKSLPQFLSPYVSDFLMNVSSYDVIAGNVSDKALLQEVTSLKEDMGKLFPPRILFPAIVSCFDALLKTNKERTVSVIEVYRYSFKTISKSDANSNYSKDILNITKKIFDVHSFLSMEDDHICNTLESLSIQAFIDLVVKLTENTLRPMYLELLNWATEKSDISHRLLSFFRLSVELSKSLKSLFLLFVGHVLKNSKDVLTKVTTANEDFNEGILGEHKFIKELVIAVLDMLSNCFFYDSQGFINKDRFESILHPLINQIDNKIHGNDEYLSFANDYLSPCIVNFAAAVNDSACWKQLNHQVLTKTKSDDEQVRLVSLCVIEKIYNRMGESYMILIPETIPFLAEILEDDSIEVEKQCQKVIQVIEEISGESIQKYL